MKSKFGASIVAMVATLVTFAFVWFVSGKPVEITHGESVAMSLAIISLYVSTKNDLLRKED